MSDNNGELLAHTSDIVAAFVSNNSMRADEVAGLIQSVHAALTGMGGPVVEPAAEIEKPTPAQIRKSVTPDTITSFIDGKPYKTLKRHLGLHGLTPETYREKYGLPNDYPMVSPNYSAQRTELAKALGLGRRGADKTAEAA